MTRPDEETLKAIMTLDGDPRWEKVKEWISKSHTEAAKARSSDAFEIWNLLSWINNAREELRRLEATKEVQ